ncbi:uncharacterized protein B0I36DRAFT_366506 [Microdochium trichocladiopsis]|uniref:Phorbol-ester/DAG-type domain-containing protein n=1 Tax=Microdochium trichocladiopsis TaxID=1682393 RepID=A0A9P8XWK6_9PEZI|nr:uncharacterized protein B0I36DRAFT_366506 [Microdochium trichocladiopsis]KAH7024569.1 hypothetical protein B0I36DRAFT_366506 [Microdochium trichocladiopsis]
MTKTKTIWTAIATTSEIRISGDKNDHDSEEHRGTGDYVQFRASVLEVYPDVDHLAAKPEGPSENQARGAALMRRLICVTHRRVCRIPWHKREDENTAPATYCFFLAMRRPNPHVVSDEIVAATPAEILELAGQPDVAMEDLLNCECKLDLNELSFGIYLDLLRKCHAQLLQDSANHVAEPYTGRGFRENGVTSGRRPHILAPSLLERASPTVKPLSPLAEIFWCIFWGTMAREPSRDQFDNAESRQLWDPCRSETSDSLPSMPRLNFANPLKQLFSIGDLDPTACERCGSDLGGEGASTYLCTECTTKALESCTDVDEEQCEADGCAERQARRGLPPQYGLRQKATLSVKYNRLCKPCQRRLLNDLDDETRAAWSKQVEDARCTTDSKLQCIGELCAQRKIQGLLPFKKALDPGWNVEKKRLEDAKTTSDPAWQCLGEPCQARKKRGKLPFRRKSKGTKLCSSCSNRLHKYRKKHPEQWKLGKERRELAKHTKDPKKQCSNEGCTIRRRTGGLVCNPCYHKEYWVE